MALTTTDSDSNIIEIPVPNIPPVYEEVKTVDDFCFVYCDIETTSLSKSCDIVQVAAVSGNDVFTQYILPSQAISSYASNVTGLAMHGNVLFYQGEPVSTSSLREALVLFLAWLDDKKPCLLIGHNFKTFDFPRLLSAFEKCHLLAAFGETVCGIIDTLPMFRKLFPHFDRHNQEHLVTSILEEQYAAHNAEHDVCSLQKLIVHVKPSAEDLSADSITFSSMLSVHSFEKDAQSNFATLTGLVEQKIVSKQMAMKIARSGLRLCHLNLAVACGGSDGLS